MAKEVITTTFQFKRGLSSAWERNNPILSPGEPGWTLDTHVLKIGDGITPWNSLKAISGVEITEADIQEAVNKYLEEHQDTTIAELKQIFPDNLQGSLGVIRTMQDTIKDYSRYYEAEHPKTKEKFYICNQWGNGNINKFIEHLDAMNIGIRIEKCK